MGKKEQVPALRFFVFVFFEKKNFTTLNTNI